MPVVFSIVLHCSVVSQLSTEADESGSYVQVLENFTNIGAIMDMSVVDLDKQGQDVVSNN